MHLFEAFTALFEATGDDYFLQHARRVFDLFTSHFFDASHDVVRERFDTTLRHADDQAAIEPGHMLEWAALLQRYEKATRQDQTELQHRLTKRAVEIGADPAFHGFVANGVTIPGGGANGAKRLWPQPEYIKACSVLARKGELAAARRVATLIESLFESYLATDKAGLWYDEFDGAGKPIARDVPASILYHLFEAVDAVRPDRSTS